MKGKFINSWLVFLILLAFTFSSIGITPVQAAGLPDTTADVVYGQAGSFTTNTPNNGGISANSLAMPVIDKVSVTDGMYVTDWANSRVLYYPAGSTTATRVYGQNGSFTTGTENKGGISAKSLRLPIGVAVYANNNVYVADINNNRVLYYPAGSTTATRVYGQGGSFTTNTFNKGGISANSLAYPTGVAVDAKGNLYVADRGNARVLYYPAGSTTATRVLGQGGSFTTGTSNKGGISAKSLSNFLDEVMVDGSGNLYVADVGNNRVLYYPKGSATATRVYGQGGSFTTNTVSGISADSLNQPCGLVVDSVGGLYIADQVNSRVLYYPAGSTTATRVYGQGGSFTTGTANNGGISADSLFIPSGVALDESGNLYISDQFNNRVLEYFKEQLSNGGFNTYVGSGTIPLYWNALNFSSSDGKDTTNVEEGSASVRIGGSSASKSLSQTILLKGIAGDTFTFSFWVMGDAIPANGACMGQVLVYKNNPQAGPGTPDILVGTYTINCPTDTFAFQPMSLTFTVPSVYYKVVVKFTYSKPSGTVWFDNASLTVR
jgi:sugar lactone lactonase YvrE